MLDQDARVGVQTGKRQDGAIVNRDNLANRARVLESTICVVCLFVERCLLLRFDREIQVKQRHNISVKAKVEFMSDGAMHIYNANNSSGQLMLRLQSSATAYFSADRIGLSRV